MGLVASLVDEVLKLCDEGTAPQVVNDRRFCQRRAPTARETGTERSRVEGSGTTGEPEAWISDTE